MLSVIIPANNEADYIGDCLDCLLASELPRGMAAEVIVVANACTDATVAVARSHAAVAASRGWRLNVLDIPEPGKLNALNVADRAARGTCRVYLDADVRVSPALIDHLAAALDRPGPVYATGRWSILPARSWLTRAYSRVWARMPFLTETVAGFGVFAVNAAGRARWGAFPDIIADDLFVRLCFAPDERVRVPAGYSLPMVEGFARLVRVRRRQDAGVTQLGRLFPELLVNEDKPPSGVGRLLRLLARDPVGFAVYGAVHLATRLPAGRPALEWTRGR